MPKISFITLGCKLNYAETSTYERGFIQAGFEAVPPTGKADICLVNTCSVTEHSDKKCRNIIRRMHRLCPEADIVVTGCSAQLRRSEIEKIEGVRFVFGAKEKGSVVRTVTEYVRNNGKTQEPQPAVTGEMPYLETGNDGTVFPAYSSGERTRSFLKVQDGCDYKCAYCTVPYARGESRNIPIADIVSQAGKIAATGIKEIVLTGVNTGDFGKTTGEPFLDLLKKLNEVEGIERYRISSIEPNLLTEDIVDWIASGTKFLPHFHIPLQSGSDTILKAMGRRYDTASFSHKIGYIREKLEKEGRPKVFFGIDVIVGFPGETDELFQETYAFLEKEIKPAFIHIFPYSRRPGTPAAAMGGQIQDKVKTERVEKLEGLCRRLHDGFLESGKGTVAKVLFESSDKGGMMYGYTENYIRVELPYDPDKAGRIVEITI